MNESTRDIIRLLRPRQWIKNLAIFAALLFNNQLFDLVMIQKIVEGFIVFCIISSSIYIINDIFDIENDRKHPFKKYRPLASNKISIPNAIMLASVLSISAIIASLLISPAFFVVTVVYFVLNLAYSAYLKHIEIIDILTLSAGYILRVFAGEIISSSHISGWLFLTVICLSLFLAIGKRRSELTLLSHQPNPQVKTRKTLSHYSAQLLDIYITIFATSTFISYALFTFLENPKGMQFTFGLIPADLLGTLLQRKWLMITIIPVAYGLMRYLQRIYEKQEGESPERVLFSDRPLLTAVLIWAFLVIILMYFLT